MRTPPWLIYLYSFILLVGVVIALPNMFSEKTWEEKVPWLPDTRVTLGLDLKGGSYLVLQVDEAAMKQERLRNLLVSVRRSLAPEGIKTQDIRLQNGGIVIAIDDAAKREKSITLIQELMNPISAGAFAVPVNDLEITENGNQIRVAITEEAMNYHISNAVEQSLEIVRKRVDEVGVAEPSIQRVGLNRIMVQLPGLQDPSHLRNLLGSTAKMTFHLVDTRADRNNLPAGVRMLPDKNNPTILYPVQDAVALDGAVLTDARSGFDEHGDPMISFRLNSEGAKKFAEITTEHTGTPFAIVLDGQVLTAPTIRQPIITGSGVITGNFTPGETATISALLRAGALPAPLTVEEERTVGPDLGADAIKMGIYTGVGGFILVAIFIILLYGYWGLIANVALALHTVLTFSALSLLGATLTLPGIAGIILGIGIAVDANILINERIREESRKGVGALAALDRGFKHAFHTIVDANITSIFAMVLLAWQGSGPVRGFAITMILGIIISMFTDITIVRIMMSAVVRRFKIKDLRITPFLSFIPQHTNFHFMNARFWGIGISIVLSIASIFLFFKPGLNYGIDFTGGSQVEMQRSNGTVDLMLLRPHLEELKLGEVTMQTVGTENNSVLIRLQQQEGGPDVQNAALDKVRQATIAVYPDATDQGSAVVGPKVSGELAKSGLIAVICAALAMTIYIWFRFEWFFAVGAIITLILDTTKMVGVFALFQFDFNLTAIAALLTIVGYSINDKVVVYDRMRENLRLYKKTSLREVIDMSINQVLVRCIFTSMTTILSMLPMAIWGGSAVHNFAVPMVIGIVIATSSSMFIAAPILLFLGNWWERKGHNTRGEDVAATA
ncbi:protein translocase subunit SecD [Bartonella sp. HY329]|uniref:protein translocase subunit SecD n=1 Tax=unclassified Bartonella TaxID=2645622 RepID=UPI0021C6FABC|nr:MULTISPECIES: protein translocase subunit SecD [unclassified Bartonella]UXM94352.1 protein translocase subunit SecD [Bartonella sp. HY329]UXN08675.1 protein translocase subunit SecD [Bartonella sp. HY328]